MIAVTLLFIFKLQVDPHSLPWCLHVPLSENFRPQWLEIATITHFIRATWDVREKKELLLVMETADGWNFSSTRSRLTQCARQSGGWASFKRPLKWRHLLVQSIAAIREEEKKRKKTELRERIAVNPSSRSRTSCHLSSCVPSGSQYTWGYHRMKDVLPSPALVWAWTMGENGELGRSGITVPRFPPT